MTSSHYMLLWDSLCIVTVTLIAFCFYFCSFMYLPVCKLCKPFDIKKERKKKHNQLTARKCKYNLRDDNGKAVVPTHALKSNRNRDEESQTTQDNVEE